MPQTVFLYIFCQKVLALIYLIAIFATELRDDNK